MISALDDILADSSLHLRFEKRISTLKHYYSFIGKELDMKPPKHQEQDR